MSKVNSEMVFGNIHLTVSSYDHYDFAEMKKTPSGISPIITIDRKAPTALHRQVYEAYRVAIVNRHLRAGQRVPSTRVLALELGISRIPVLTAYAQLLAEGYFESHVGSGTVVSRSLPDQVALSEAAGGQSTGVRGSRRMSERSSKLFPTANLPWHRGWGAFGVSQIDFGQFPFPVWNRLVTRHCRNTYAKSLDYGDAMGAIRLREAIASYLRTARGVRCETEQIMIVSGSQQALEISTRVLLDPGSRVWMEEPGYRFARNVFAINGCRIVPVPVDYQGLQVAAGVKLCRSARAALVTPSHQYPLGVTMSASRRLQLLDWAQRSESWIIEDDYDSEYRYDSRPIASLQGLDNNSRVIYIGTFSKVLFPSLRMGYLVIPRDLIDAFLTVRTAMDIGPPNFFQAVLADFISDGHFSRHIRRMRLLYEGRRGALIDSIHKELGFGAEVTGEQAGLHLSLTLKGIRDREVAERAARQGLWLVPLSSCYQGQPSRQGFILGFGSTGAAEIPKAVRKLRTVMVSR